MNKTEILMIGSKEELQVVAIQINANEQWKTTCANTVEEAIEKFHRHSFDVVVLTNSTNEQEERKLRKVFTHQHPDIIIVSYRKDDSSTLSAKIQEALDKRQQENKPVVSFTDDALKNAGLDITIQ